MIQDWKRIARSLPRNGHTRVPCCGSDNSAIISHGPKFYRVHCFRCGFTEALLTKRTLSLSDLYMLNNIEAFEKEAKLPSDSTYEFPMEHWIWLAQAGIINPSQYGIQYSPMLDRIILPVHNRWSTQKPSGYQARSLSTKPKYITSGNAECHVNMSYKTDNICIVEDILSSIKVSKVTSALALIGTHLTDKAIRNIIDYDPTNIFVWLDPDKAGQTAAATICRRLSILDLGVCYNIVSDRDPKYHSYAEIERYLYGD